MERRQLLKMAAASLVLPYAGLKPTPARAATTPHGTWSMFSRHIQYVSTAAQAAADPYGTGVRVGEQAAQMGAAR